MLPKSLIDGYLRFGRETYTAGKARYEELGAHGQSPIAMVVSCCDSRVDTSAIFDVGPGELFVVRNVANLVPPFEKDGKYFSTSAAAEFAITGLNVPNIIVIGHSKCGGIAAYRESLKGKPDESAFVGTWISQLAGLDTHKGDLDAFGEEKAFELAGVRRSLANLRGYDVVKEREANGKLALYGMHFDIGSGTVLALDEAADKFAPLS